MSSFVARPTRPKLMGHQRARRPKCWKAIPLCSSTSTNRIEVSLVPPGGCWASRRANRGETRRRRTAEISEIACRVPFISHTPGVRISVPLKADRLFSEALAESRTGKIPACSIVLDSSQGKSPGDSTGSPGINFQSLRDLLRLGVIWVEPGGGSPGSVSRRYPNGSSIIPSRVPTSRD